MPINALYSSTPASDQTVTAAAVDEDVDVVGLSMLSGAHMTLAPLVVEALRSRGASIRVVVGGIVPKQDIPLLKAAGISEVLGPGAPGTAVVDTIRAAANAQ